MPNEKTDPNLAKRPWESFRCPGCEKTNPNCINCGRWCTLCRPAETYRDYSKWCDDNVSASYYQYCLSAQVSLSTLINHRFSRAKNPSAGKKVLAVSRE